MNNLLFKRNDTDFLATKMGDEMVIMNKESGQFLGLNSVGADIWELLTSPQTLVTLVDQLLKEYKVTREQCALEVRLFTDQLKKQNMLIFI